MSERDPQPDRPQLPLEVEQQIDRVSDEFERAWKSGTDAAHRGLPGSRSGGGTIAAARRAARGGVRFAAAGRVTAAGCGRRTGSGFLVAKP